MPLTDAQLRTVHELIQGTPETDYVGLAVLVSRLSQYMGQVQSLTGQTLVDYGEEPPEVTQLDDGIHQLVNNGDCLAALVAAKLRLQVTAQAIVDLLE